MIKWNVNYFLLHVFMSFSQNVKKSSLHSVLFFVFWLSFGFFWGYYLLGLSDTPTHDPQENKIEKPISTGIFSDKKAKEVYNLIEKNYFRFSEKSSKKVQDAFLESLVKSLWDKHSSYFNTEDTEEFMEVLKWDFEGIGAVVGFDVHGVRILRVLEGSPAQKSGFQNGDILTAVNGETLVGVDLNDAIELIRGPRHSSIEVSYIRDEKYQEILMTTVVRDVVNIPSVSHEVIDDKYGYIQISTFGDHTIQDFDKALEDLSKKQIQWIILDFRDNWGGYLNVAIDMASAFLPENSVVVRIRENDERKNSVHYTHSRKVQNHSIPLVVLVNGYSASASEIMAWALGENKRAITIGEKTYGKWSVQEIYSLGDGSIAKLTTAKWYTPEDNSIDEKWITPNIVHYLTDEDYEKNNDEQLNIAKKVLQDIISGKEKNEEIIDKYKKK